MIGLSAVLGFDVASDIAVDERHDIPAIFSKQTAPPQIERQWNPAESALPQEAPAPTAADREDTRGIGTGIKALALAFAVFLRMGGPVVKPPITQGFQAAVSSVVATPQSRLYETRIPIPKPLSERLASNPELLARALDSMSQEMCELILRSLPDVLQPALDVKSVWFSVVDNELIVAVDAAIVRTAEELKAFFGALPDLIRTYCKKLLDEKLNAFAETWQTTPNERIETHCDQGCKQATFRTRTIARVDRSLS